MKASAMHACYKPISLLFHMHLGRASLSSSLSLATLTRFCPPAGISPPSLRPRPNSQKKVQQVLYVQARGGERLRLLGIYAVCGGGERAGDPRISGLWFSCRRCADFTMIADFCRLASSPQPPRPPRPPWPQSRPIVVVIAVRGRFRKEGRFLKLVACGHDATEERGREEVPHTNRTHAHAPTPPAKPRPARASERRRERARPQYPTTPPLHLAARSGNPPPPLLLRPDALQSVVARRCSARDLNVRTEGVL